MSRLGNMFLSGSLYDPNRTRTVQNVIPVGVQGQAASFAAAEEAKRQRQIQLQQEAQQQAQALQQATQQQIAAAQQREDQARSQAVADQQARLQQQQFENQLRIQQQQQQEQLSLSQAREQYQRQQQAIADQQRQQQAYAAARQQQIARDRQLGMSGQRTTYPGDDGIYRTAFSHAVNDHFNARLRGGYSGPTPNINVFGQSSINGGNRGLGRSAVIAGAHGGGAGGSSRTTSRNVPSIGGAYSRYFTQ